MKQQENISTAIQSQFEQQISFLQRLVRAKSMNPFTPETAQVDVPVEKEVATIIQQELQHLEFPAQLVGITQERPNVLCHIPGSNKTKKTLILTTHMDTVDASQSYTRDPWSAQIEGNRLYGVGVADAKAQIAAFIYAVSALNRADVRLAGNITLAFVADEETGACSPYGTQYLLDRGLLHGDAAIIGEPGNSKIALAHRGLYRFRIHIKGQTTHTGIRAWEQGTQGRNAILDMAYLAHALSKTPLPETTSPAFPRRRSVLTFPTLIQGGSGMNIVPGSCEAYGDVRLLPGLSAGAIRQLIEEQCRALSIQDYRIDDLLIVPPAETNPDAEIVQTLATSVEVITGMRPLLEGAGPACDGWMFITRGIPTICGYGVKCAGVHGADEWADLESLRQVTEVYALTILSYLSHE